MLKTRPVYQPAPPALKAIDHVWLFALCAYLVLGTGWVPFFQDENTNLTTVHDFSRMLEGRWNEIFYAPDRSLDGQFTRFDNGMLIRHLTGLVWYAAGYEAGDLPPNYDYNRSLEDNIALGTVPTLDRLLVARLPSVALFAAGVVALFALAWRLGGRPAAWLATLYTTLQPDLLMDARRVMQEGALFCLTLVTLLAGVHALNGTRQTRWIGLGVAGGLLVAAKPTGIAALVGVWLALFTYPLIAPLRRQPLDWRQVRQTGIGLFGAGVLALVVYYALNPAWWSYPLDAPRVAVEIRQQQMESFIAYTPEAYTDLDDRVRGYGAQLFKNTTLPDPGYAGAYPWSGVYLPPSLHGLAYALIALGLVGLLVRTADNRAGWLTFCWAVAVHLIIGAANVLPWARYYLPFVPILGVVMGVGLSFAFALAGSVLPVLGDRLRQRAAPAMPVADEAAS